MKIERTMSILKGIDDKISKLDLTEFDFNNDIDNLLKDYGLEGSERGIYSNFVCDLHDLYAFNANQVIKNAKDYGRKNVFKRALGITLAFSLFGTGIGYLIDNDNGPTYGFYGGLIASLALSRPLSSLFAKKAVKVSFVKLNEEMWERRDKLFTNTLDKIVSNYIRLQVQQKGIDNSK